MWQPSSLAIVLLCACTGRELGSAGTTTTTSSTVDGSESGGETGATASTTTDASSTTRDASTDDGSTVEADTGCQGFLCHPDGGDVGDLECDLWIQDCPVGLKCMPWANDGGNFWNDTKCSPVADDPGAPGDACTAKGSGITGIDDCGLGSMCWDVDSDSLAGSCVAFCEGDSMNPTCDDPSKHCRVLDEAVLALCLTACDPLVTSCQEGELCFPLAMETGAEFGCAPAIQNPADYGGECRFSDRCDVGHACVHGGGGSCEDGSNCCAALCSLEDGDPNPACPDADIGQICTPWYAVAAAPPELEHVGICTLP